MSSIFILFFSSLPKYYVVEGKELKNLPAMQETRVWSPGREDPLEKEMATHCSILAWETPWTEEPGGLQFMESQESDTSEQLNSNQESSLEQRYTFLRPHTGVWPHQAFPLYDRCWFPKVLHTVQVMQTVSHQPFLSLQADFSTSVFVFSPL